ncbi:hypothetical protein TWF281_006612 [Arthrobotrys megalospora]
MPSRSNPSPPSNLSSNEELVLIPLEEKLSSPHLRITVKVPDAVHLEHAEEQLCPSAVTSRVSDILWLPRPSVGLDEESRKVHEGLRAEKEITIAECFRQYPKAIGWCLLLFLTVIMEAYDKSLISGFIAFPAFRARYGAIKLAQAADANPASKSEYEISPLWQMGLQNAAVGCEIIGLLAHGYITYSIGYQKMMIACLAWACLAVFPSFFANGIGTLLVAQALSGIPWGVIQTLAATYAAEVVPAALRACILSNVNMCWLVGQLLGTAVLRSLVDNKTEWSYRLPFALQWVFAVPLLFGVCFAPESPWWLVRNERSKDAYHSLERLSGKNNPAISDTIALMEHVNKVEHELNYGGSSYFDLFRGANRRRTEIACMVWSCQALCGGSLTGYAPYFLEQAGFSSSKSFTLSSGMYAMGIVGGMISWFLLSHVGRRRLYISGLLMSTIVLCVGGIISVTLTNHAGVDWALGSLIIFMTFVYNITIGPVCYVVVAEIPSARLRVKTVALARIVYNIFIIINNIVAPQLLNPTALDLQGKACFIYAATALLCLSWCYLRLPETKDLSFLELDILFERGAPTPKFKKLKDRLANSAYISLDKAERLRNAWHGWLAYS